MFKENVAAGSGLNNISLCDQQAWSLNRLIFPEHLCRNTENFHKNVIMSDRATWIIFKIHLFILYN